MGFNKAYGILILTALNDVIPFVLAYTNLTLQNDKVCSNFLGILGENDKSGLLIHESNYFNRFSSEHKLDCIFKIKTSFNFGLFAVIQKMNLRLDNSGECLDYIQFRQLKNNFKSKVSEVLNLDVDILFMKNSHNWGKKYCGSMSAFEAGDLEQVFPQNGLSLNGFVEETGSLAVRIVISNQHFPPRDNLSLEIAFTAYQDCSRDIGAYRLCGNNTCIWKNYFRDGIVNCPYLKCIDEGSCSGDVYDKNVVFISLGTKVTITAVSSIFISFFLFLGCIWLCKYFEILCWGIGTIRHRNNPVEMDPMHRLTPTAPSQQQTPLDKDLPPSYETLFPDSPGKSLRLLGRHLPALLII